MSEVCEWLQKARNDLLSAQILVEHKPPVLDTAAFHCQQAVEKLLKAFLVWKSVSFEKVHSLVYLLDLCEQQEASFAGLRDAAEVLAPYGVAMRYPGEVMGAELEEVQEAPATAEAVWDFVLDLVPTEVRFGPDEGCSPWSSSPQALAFGSAGLRTPRTDRHRAHHT